MTFTGIDVLLKAASRIEEEGMWCQKRFIHGTARCAIQHLVEVGLELESGTFTHASYLLRQYLNENITDFNDAPGRTAHEVAEAMRQAALQ